MQEMTDEQLGQLENRGRQRDNLFIRDAMAIKVGSTVWVTVEDWLNIYQHKSANNGPSSSLRRYVQSNGEPKFLVDAKCWNNGVAGGIIVKGWTIKRIA